MDSNQFEAFLNSETGKVSVTIQEHLSSQEGDLLASLTINSIKLKLLQVINHCDKMELSRDQILDCILNFYLELK